MTSVVRVTRWRTTRGPVSGLRGLGGHRASFTRWALWPISISTGATPGEVWRDLNNPRLHGMVDGGVAGDREPAHGEVEVVPWEEGMFVWP